ncbi:hypothetical protein D7X55_08510 [Corallococcus sp. AB049A]|uniref:Uncharacterized protein n=1 Tax=Corallococcus interemptor TaxID=2316720 RepID=A0A3A8QNX2_9BACT|nr:MULTISPECIES: hypothetical protein [Corallococcus]RKH48960.1 hypothetical protein D7Y23_18470 [Corallococcus sp. AB050B]RKH69521.1 hypothetical protein D7X96_14600 [Corallococcus interemptor]RKI71969.1 hypothetical protein D7X55_08510 [Corallococcus sp. AB049A]
MRTVIKSLLASASFLALAPLPAAAAQCQGVCGCGVPCERRCNIGAVVTTCGNEQLCIDYCRAPSALGEAALEERRSAP